MLNSNYSKNKTAGIKYCVPIIQRGQSTLEFVFAMIAAMFLLYGMVQVFRWVGMDMAQRRWASDANVVYRPSRINASPGVDLGQ